jgi:hypothetical protein
LRTRQVFRLALGALTGHGLRTGLSLLGVTIGVAAVVVLTALTDGARAYVVQQFSSLGTNLIIVLPGYTETTGGGVPGITAIPNDLTLADAEAIAQRVRSVRRAAPMSMGTEEVSYRERRRQVALIGATSDYQGVRQVEVARGEFLPPGDIERGAPICVLGHTLARELFVGENPVGQVVGQALPIRAQESEHLRCKRPFGVLADRARINGDAAELVPRDLEAGGVCDCGRQPRLDHHGISSGLVDQREHFLGLHPEDWRQHRGR